MTILIATSIAISAFGQTPLKLVKERVGNPEILKNWSVGEVKYANNAEILRVSGDNDIDYRTNVFYTSNKTIMGLVEQKTGALPEEQKQAMTECYFKDAPGGQISLFFDRNEPKLADPTHFTVFVKNEAGEIIYQKALAYERPYYYKWGIWYYYITINVPVDVGPRFTVEVTDSGLKKTYEFRVSITDADAADQQLMSEK